MATQASLTDVFHSVSLNLSASIPAADHTPQPIPAAPLSALPAQSRRKLQTSSFDLGNTLKSVQAEVKTLGSDVDALISTIQAAEQFFTSGRTYQNSAQQAFDLYSFNVDNTTHQGPVCQFPIEKVLTASVGNATVTGTCQNCYAYIGVTITAAINIQSGQLVEASVIMDGTATSQSTFDLVAKEGDVDVSGHITTLSAGPIEFLLAGIPIKLTSSTPISLGVSGTVAGTMPVTLCLHREACACDIMLLISGTCMMHAAHVWHMSIMCVSFCAVKPSLVTSEPNLHVWYLYGLTRLCEHYR